MTLKMRSFLVVPDWGRKFWIHVFAWEKETSCTYKKEERLEQRELQEWVKVSILVVGDVNPTKNIQELKNERIILTGNSVRTWIETHI
jgi:hypothetical protein